MSNTTIPTQNLGPHIIQAKDFYYSDGILHPVIIGTIALICLFLYLRFASNRSLSQMSVFDAIVSVALGSTVAGIVNGTSLVRGLMALIVLFSFQYLTSFLMGNYPASDGWLASPPLIIVFRGKALKEIMRKHRISNKDLNAALRQAKIWSIDEVEVVGIEPTGAYSIYKRADYPKDYEPDVLWDMAGYKALRENAEKHDEKDDDDVAQEES